MRELPPSLPPSTTFFPLSLLQTSRSLLLVLPLLPFHSFSLSLPLSFFFYITSIFFQLSSSHCLSCSYPLRVSPSVFHYFLFFLLYLSGSLCLYLSLFLSLRLCFVSFNSDRPFAKCAKRTLMGKRVKRKERGEKERKEGWTRWLDNWAFVSSMRALSFRRRLYPHHCNVHRIFDFVAVTSGSADGIYFN